MTTDRMASLWALGDEHQWQVQGPQALQSGQKLVVRAGGEKIDVTFFNNGNIQLQGGSGVLKDSLTKWREAALGSPPQSAAVVSDAAEGPPGFNAIYRVSLENPDELADVFSRAGAEVTSEPPTSDHQLRVWKIKQGSSRVRATLFTTGRLQLQGVRSQLTFALDREMDNVSERSVKERVLVTASNEREAQAVADFTAQPTADSQVAKWINDNFSAEVLAFIPDNERDIYESGVFGLLIAEQHPKEYKNKIVLVMPFARAYEGFLLKFFCELGLVTEEQLRKDLNTVKAGELLDRLFTCIQQANKASLQGWKDNAWSAWRDIRHKTMHADDPNSPRYYFTLADARQDIAVLNRAMRTAYGYKSKQSTKTDTQAASSQTLTGPAPLPTLPIHAEPDIGADETGKGDYFGPIVFAAVYGDSRVRAALRALGVQESKKISDRPFEDLKLMAQSIKELTQVEVLMVPMEEYNATMGLPGANLNVVMAERHLVNIQALTGKVQATNLLLDQFDQSNDQHVKKLFEAELPGLKFDARPRADGSDILVAAASVLALVEQRAWFEQVKSTTGIGIPRGSSDIQGITAAVGKLKAKLEGETLSKYVKLHHRTTQKVEAELGMQLL